VEALLEAGEYDVVFIESVSRAYSHIKRALPDAVIVCLEEDDVEAFQVLTMLRLDGATAHIPVMTYMTVPDADDSTEPFEIDRASRSRPSAPLMN
jgi:CheY-like chemotaxis protein